VCIDVHNNSSRMLSGSQKQPSEQFDLFSLGLVTLPKRNRLPTRMGSPCNGNPDAP